MSWRLLLVFAVLFWSASLTFFAQSPAKSVAPSPSPVATAAPQPTSTPTTKSLVDSMDSTDLKEAIQLLKNNYIKPEALNETELSRATFEGLLTRLGRGVVLLSDAAADPAEPATPFYGEIIEGHIGYLRLGTLSRANLDALDANIQTFGVKKVDAVVLDLRASAATNDFPAALSPMCRWKWRVSTSAKFFSRASKRG